jgi:hypothetical protein
MAREEGLLLNAAAIIENGRGSVFLGVPGNEGSMAAELSGGDTVLNEDILIIKPHNGGFRFYRTPFGRKPVNYGSNNRAKIEGLYCVKKGRQNSLISLDKAQALAYLNQHVPLFNGDSQLRDKIFGACRALAERVPVYELRCPSGVSWRQMINGNEGSKQSSNP